MNLLVAEDLGEEEHREAVAVGVAVVAQRVAAITAEAENVAGVQEVRSLHVRQRGSWYLADVRLAVHPEHTIASAHDIAHAAEERIRERVDKVARVFVHVEPGDPAGSDCPDMNR